jgi:fluoride ion exporter CrcB/FEX
MKKGIAIETILLLLVGILVVGIITYLVYRYSTSSSLSVTDCRGSLSTICTMCSIQKDWTGNVWSVALSADYKTTIKTCNDYNEFSSFLENSASCADIKNQCKLLGIQ